jgi:hypothetical protein
MVDFHAKRPHSKYIQHHPVSALANQCSWFDSGLRPYPWRSGNTNCGHPECGGESERSCSMYVQKGWIYFHAKRPHSHYIRHHPVSALANQCSWFESGLRPYPWRGWNTICGHPECGGESERSCSMYVQKWWISMQNDPILTTFDTTPSPHWRINAAGLILAFAHINGEAGTPTVGIRSAVVSRNGPVLCMCRNGGFPCRTTPFSLHSTPPHLRIGESMQLV